MSTLMVVLGLVLIGGGLVLLWCWAWHQTAVREARQVNDLIRANRASHRPGMAQPDPRGRLTQEFIRRQPRGPDVN